MAGALAGGVLIGVSEVAGRPRLITPSAKSMFSFALLIVVLAFRPQGLFAALKRTDEGPRSPLFTESPPRSRDALLALLALLVAAPLLIDRYLLSVVILVLYFAFVGQAWNIMMGFVRPALARPRAVRRASAPTRRPRSTSTSASTPWLGMLAAVLVCVAVGHADRLARVSLRHLRHLLRAADDRVRRVHAHRLRPLRLGRRLGRLLPQGRAAGHASTAEPARPPARCSTTSRWRSPRAPSCSPPGCCAAAPATTSARSATTRRRRAPPASTPSAAR